MGLHHGQGSGANWDMHTRTQALEGKDIKDLLSNVGSGGGAAAPAAGGAAGGGAAAAEETKAEEKEEGELTLSHDQLERPGEMLTDGYREGGVGRGYGFRSLRLDGSPRRRQYHPSLCTSKSAWTATGILLPSTRWMEGNNTWLPGWRSSLRKCYRDDVLILPVPRGCLCDRDYQVRGIGTNRDDEPDMMMIPHLSQ